MAALYEIASEFRKAFETYEYIDDLDEAEQEAAREGWFEALSDMEDDVQDKAVNVGKYIKNLTAEVDAIKAEEAKLKARRQTKENAVERMKNYLLNCLDTACLKKIETAQIAISVRSNAESVSIADTAGFIKWAQDTDNDDLLRYKAPEVDKTAVKAALKCGAQIPGAELTRSRSVVIK